MKCEVCRKYKNSEQTALFWVPEPMLGSDIAQASIVVREFSDHIACGRLGINMPISLACGLVIT
jgi:hypothetical protein